MPDSGLPNADQQQLLAHEIAVLNWVDGPNTIEIANVAGFDIPAGYEMLAPPDSLRFIQLNGNPTTDADNGDYILQNDDPNSGWFAILNYEPGGHIADTKPIDADTLLATMQQLSAEDNANRQKQGISPLTLTGWAFPPNYDPQTHRLEWAFNFVNSDGSKLINLNTRILGRAGDLKIILVDGPDQLNNDLPDFNHAMNGFSFNTGQRYEDFRPGDPVASYGLAGLIGGANPSPPPPAPPPPKPNHLAEIEKALIALIALVALAAVSLRVFASRR